MSPRPQSRPQAAILDSLYDQSKGKPVAYLDETYRSPAACQADEAPFYLVTAVVVPRESRSALTSELNYLIDSHYWHTTESLQTEEGRAKTLDLCRLLGAEEHPCLIACKVDAAASDPENMRRECLRTLFAALQQGSEDERKGWPRVHHFVMERRRTRQDVAADQKIMTEARKDGLVARDARLASVSPADEHLLWLPDLVASAIRQQIVHDRRLYVEPLLPRLRMIPTP